MRGVLISGLTARDPANVAIQTVADELGLAITIASPADAASVLDHGSEPVVAIVAPDIDQPTSAARQIHRTAPRARMIFVSDGRRHDLPRVLSHTPFIGNLWEVAPLEPTLLTAAVDRAVRAARQQRQLRTTLDRINIHLKEHSLPDPLDHRRLLLSDHFLSALFSASPDVLVASDPMGRILLWNRTAEHVTRLMARDAVGQTVAQVLSDESSRAVVAGVDAVSAGAECVKVQVAIGAPGRHFEALIVPVRADRQVVAVLIVARDVSEREELEQALRSRAAQLQMATRQKDEFLMTLSHELRTPLNAILGWGMLLHRGGVPSTHGADVIVRNAHALRRLVEDLLDVAGIVSGKPRLHVRPIDPAASVAAAIDAVRPSADAKQVRLQVVLDPTAGPLAGDSDRLQQIAWNLLSNAIKFTPKGGRVQVRLERVNSHVQLIVSDTGSGIEAAFLPYVFDRFRQQDSGTMRAHGGLGLGLSIVKQLVELHGGTVSVESPGPGEGATFRVRIPIIAARVDIGMEELAPSGNEREHSSVDGVSLDNVTVMVVDDEADARELLTVILEQAGATVAAMPSAEAALARLKVERPSVLVSDIEMPGTDGYTLISAVRQFANATDLPAIALTAYARVEDRVRALRSGFQAHVPKPCEPAELTALVAALARRRV